MSEMSIWPLRKTWLKPIYTSATNQRLSLRRDVQAYAITCAVPDVHLSKHLTERQFNADRKRCDWSARTPPSVCTFMSTVI